MHTPGAPGNRAITGAFADRWNGNVVGAKINEKDVVKTPTPRLNRPAAVAEGKQPIRGKKKYTSFDQTPPVKIGRSKNERVTGSDSNV